MACIGIGIGIGNAGTCSLGRKKVSKSNEGLRLVERREMNSVRIKSMSSPIKVAPKREKDPKKRIVITGMGVVSVFGNEIDTFYNKLLEGESGISLIDRFDVSTFPVRFAGQIRNFSSEGYIDEKNGKMNLDDCWRYYLVAGKKALEDANLGCQILDTMDKTRIGVVVGTGMGGTSSMNNAVEALIEKGHEKISEYFIPFFLPNMGSAMLAMERGLTGPNYSIASACASANYCFHAAGNHIRRGETDIMVVGGTESIIPATVGGFIACRALSQRNQNPKMASRPWDIHRDGFVMGEGSGVLIMESLESARKRGAKIIAEYLGGAITCDAHHMTDPRSDGFGVASCIRNSLADAGVSPEEVNYLNAHATSTLAGDLAEVCAIKKVFKDTSEMKMNATKSITGHALGAAGALEAIVTIKAITTGWLHPTINQDNLEEEVTIDTVPDVKKKHQVNVAISNSFGFGGHNSVVVFAPFMP